MNISQFYHPELIKLYKTILRDLNIEFHKQSNLEYLYSKNFKNSYKVMFDNKQMILADGDWTYIPEKLIKSKLIFNPTDECCSHCSNLTLTDAIHSKLSNYIYRIFKIIIEKKLNINIKENDYYSFDRKDINVLPIIDIHTLHKWVNLYNIITATSFSRNLISFSFTYNSVTQSSKVEFDYPLYRYLEEIKNNKFFSITLEDSEVKFFKNIYKSFIINIFEDLLNNDINIPQDSNKCPVFYILIKLFLNIKELLSNEYRLEFLRRDLSFIKEELNDLNKYIYSECDEEEIKNFEEIKKADNEAYSNEIEIRKKSNPDWLLLKDNIVEEKLPVVQDHKEIIPYENNFNKESVDSLNKLFEFLSDEKAIKRYKNSLNEIISLEKKIHNINIANSKRDYQKQRDRENKLDDIYYWQDIVLNIINRDVLCLWLNNEDDKYYFRAGVSSKVKSGDKKKISKKINSSVNQKINDFIIRKNYNRNKPFSVEVRIVDNIEEATRITEKLNLNNMFVICIFSNKIPIVEDEVFDITVSKEFFKCYDSLNLTRNLFVHNKNLLKRHQECRHIDVKKESSFELEPNEEENILYKNKYSSFFESDTPSLEYYSFTDNGKKSFIEKFIYYMLKENPINYAYVMNWLASFFKRLEKTNVAIALVGDRTVKEELFLELIIKQIFGFEYCTTISDEEYSKVEISNIIKNKIFFHIGTIDNKKSKFNNETLSKILKELLVKESVKTKNKDNKFEIVPIYGQTIITSDEVYEIAKSCYSKCTVLKVNDLQTILEKLEVPDESMLETKILEDIELFSSILSIYPTNRYIAKYALNTEDRDIDNNVKDKKINEKISASQVDDFILAFKNYDLKYFDTLKDDEELYKPLKAALEKGYFINQYLFDYFCKIYNNHNFESKTLFINELKEKDEMFKQESDVIKAINEEVEEKVLLEGVSSFKEVNYKKLSRIKNYKLAKDILVPKGFIITNREGKARFKYEYEDIETAKKMYDKYDRKQLQKKQETK